MFNILIASTLFISQSAFAVMCGPVMSFKFRSDFQGVSYLTSKALQRSDRFKNFGGDVNFFYELNSCKNTSEAQISKLYFNSSFVDADNTPQRETRELPIKKSEVNLETLKLGFKDFELDHGRFGGTAKITYGSSAPISIKAEKVKTAFDEFGKNKPSVLTSQGWQEFDVVDFHFDKKSTNLSQITFYSHGTAVGVFAVSPDVIREIALGAKSKGAVEATGRAE